MHQDDFTPSQFQDRRQRTEDSILALIKVLQEQIGDLKKAISEVEAKVSLNNAVYHESADRLVAKALKDAFPEGDAPGHKAHHEALIQQAKDRAEFWKTMRTKLSEWGLIGFAGWAVYYLWIAFLQGPKK